MGRRTNKAKLVRANLESKMDEEGVESKSPDNSDFDEAVGMKDVQGKTPSPHQRITARKAVAPPKKPPLASEPQLQMMTAMIVTRMLIQARQNPKAKPTPTTRLDATTQLRSGNALLRCVG